MCINIYSRVMRKVLIIITAPEWIALNVILDKIMRYCDTAVAKNKYH